MPSKQSTARKKPARRKAAARAKAKPRRKPSPRKAAGRRKLAPGRKPASRAKISDAERTAPVKRDAGPMVEVASLTTGYGDRPALHDVSFSVDRGQVAVILGLNGAGKTTTVKALCGTLPVWSGQIRFEGDDITSWRTPACVRAGIVLVPEGRHVFPDLSVDDNLQVGSWAQRSDRKWIAEQREKVFTYLPRLRERRTQLAGTLSGGEQQMLAIGRGLMARPRLLLIDEASLGLAPVIVKEIFKIAHRLTEDGTTVILVEQNVGALEVADVGYFMAQGAITAELRGKQLRDTERIRRLYLG